MECRHGYSSNIIVWRMGPGVSCKNARGLDEVLAGGGGVGAGSGVVAVVVVGVVAVAVVVVAAAVAAVGRWLVLL